MFTLWSHKNYRFVSSSFYLFTNDTLFFFFLNPYTACCETSVNKLVPVLAHVTVFTTLYLIVRVFCVPGVSERALLHSVSWCRFENPWQYHLRRLLEVKVRTLYYACTENISRTRQISALISDYSTRWCVNTRWPPYLSRSHSERRSCTSWKMNATVRRGAIPTWPEGGRSTASCVYS